MLRSAGVRLASHDLIVIGSGPGGYVAAIRAAQQGLNVACVEMKKHGGTCLNVGCIPSKALLNASHHYHAAKHDFEKFGIQVPSVTMDVSKMLQMKQKTVSQLVGGISGLFKANKVTAYTGRGKIVGKGKVSVTKADGTEEIHEAKNILIATGSEPVPLPFMPFDEKVVCSSTGALDFPAPPKRLIVIGGGVIGLELGSVWSRLGSEVSVVEFLEQPAPFLDSDVQKQFKSILEKQGLKFKCSTKVTSGEVSNGTVKLVVEPAQGGQKETLEAEAVLVSIGRRPYTDGLGLEKVGVKLDKRNFIEVDDHFKTNVEGIFGIGDVINKPPMLAHKAEDEGIACADIIAGKAGHVNYGAIPSVIYTYPEVAWVGKTDNDCKKEGLKTYSYNYPYIANSRAVTNNDTAGFVKVISDASTDRLLGMHIIGSNAGEAIAEAVLALEYGASCEDIWRTCHAHPTLSEAVKEACMGAAEKKPIHFPKTRIASS